MSGSVLARLAEKFPAVRFEKSTGQDVCFVERELLGEFAAGAKEEGFDLYVDTTAVDYLRRIPRFEIVTNLLSIGARTRLRIRTGVPADDAQVPSLTPLYPGANFFEREVYDLFGIEFTGHPDLTRILMPDDWEGHPLRKDYPVGAVPVQFRDAHRIE